MRVTAVRVVEGQHRNSTRKLVDSDDEQLALEQLLDDSKPAPVQSALHYLLSTPFRYPPLRHGSRFGRRHERGIWYGSRKITTALAETAYYRLLFLAGTKAVLAPLQVELTSFKASLASAKAVDLTKPPFSSHRELLASPSSYTATHILGSAMREDGAELVAFVSARDPAHGDNIAAFTPSVFTSVRPRDERRWACNILPDAVEFRDCSLVAATQERYRFARSTFEVDGALPRPSA